MGDEDLSRLKIEKISTVGGPSGNRKKIIYAAIGAAAALLIAILFLAGC